MTVDSALAAMLRKSGRDQGEIDEALSKFESAPENSKVGIAPGFEIVKWTVARVDPKLDGRSLLVQATKDGEEYLDGAGIVLLKIAFEYIALHVGLRIYDTIFDSIREALLKNDPSLCLHRVEWLKGPRLEPFHGILLERRPPYLVVQIRLFEELVYRVHFPNLSVIDEFPKIKYAHSLLSGDENFDGA